MTQLPFSAICWLFAAGSLSLLSAPSVAFGQGTTINIYTSPSGSPSVVTNDANGSPTQQPTSANPNANTANDPGYMAMTERPYPRPTGLTELSTSHALMAGTLRGAKLYTDAQGNLYVAGKAGACGATSTSSCFALTITDRAGAKVDLKNAKGGIDASKLDGALAKLNESGQGAVNAPSSSGCERLDISDDNRKVERCDGKIKITYANGSVEIRDEFDFDPSGKTKGELSGFDAKKAVDKEFDWKASGAMADARESDLCKVGKGIDASRFNCATDISVKGAAALRAGSEIGGAVSIQARGSAVYNQVLQNGGAPDVVYNGQADLMESAGKTQKTVGAINLAAGMVQLLGMTKALRARNDLLKEKKELDAKLSVNKQDDMSGDGTLGGDGYVHVKVEDMTRRKGGFLGLGKKKIDDISHKVVENFELNKSAKLTAFSEKRAYDTSTGKAANHATEMRDQEVAAKMGKVKSEAHAILNKAIEEQTQVAGRALQGAMISSTQGGVQIANGKQMIESAGAIRKLADALKTQPQGSVVPPTEIHEASMPRPNNGAQAPLISGSPDGPVSNQQTADNQPQNTGGLGGGFNPLPPSQDPGAGPRAGVFRDADPSAGGAMGGTAGSVGGGSPSLGGAPHQSAAQAGGITPQPVTPPARVDTARVGGYEHAPGSASGSTGSLPSDNALADMMKNLMREDGAGKKVENSGDMEFGGRAPASAGGGEVLLGSDTNLFSQISAVYRDKTEQGAVGAGPR